MAASKFESHSGGGDWAQAAELFRKYDADGSGYLDRSELLAALREADLLACVSAAAAGRALADMDTNHDGQISFAEFREAYSRLARLKAAEQRQARFHSRTAAPVVPPNAAVDPRLRAAFQAFASHGAAKGLTERGTRGGSDGMASRQFQRACAAAGLPLESGAVDVVFASHVTGRGRTLSFQRFLEALAQVAQESGMVLEELLEAVRRSAPTGSPGSSAAAAGTTSPGADPKPSPRAGTSPRPKSAAFSSRAGPGRAPHQEAGPAGPLELEVAAGSPSAAAPQLNKLQQSVMTLQQLLEQGPEEEGGIPAHLGKAAPPVLGGMPCTTTQQAQRTGDRLLLNPAFQGQEGGADLAAFRLQMLALLDQRCEATERSCAALVATRADMAQALSQVSATLGGASAAAAAAAEAKEALSVVRELQAQLSAMDSRLSGAVHQAQETRAAVSVLEAQVEALQRSQDAALRQTNEAILCIARRVGALAVPGPGQQQQQQA